MEFGGTVSDDKMFIGIFNNEFEKVEKCKFLGVYLDFKLNWDDQIEHVISQVSKSCGTLYKYHHPLSYKTVSGSLEGKLDFICGQKCQNWNGTLIAAIAVKTYLQIAPIF